MTRLRASSTRRLGVRRSLRAALSAAASLLALATLAASAQASEGIESFQSTMIENNTTTPEVPRAGGHPDLETSFTLEKPGEPESAKTVTFNAPQGVFGNSNAITQCSASALGLDECPPDSQAGLITIYGRYEGNPHYLLGTAPIYDLVPRPGETARFSFVVPTVDIPIAISDNVRTNGDYGLSFAVTDITQATPLAGAKLTFWGFPADASHNSQRFLKGSPGEPAGCAGSRYDRLHERNYGDDSRQAADRQPNSAAQGNRSPHHSRFRHTKTSATSPKRPRVTRRSPNAKGTPSTRSYLRVPRQAKPMRHLASAWNWSLPNSRGWRPRRRRLNRPSSRCRQGSPLTPMRQTARATALMPRRTSAPRVLPNARTAPRLAPPAIESPTLNTPLTGSVYIGEPQPGNQYRLFLIASGSGMNVKLTGSFKPNPETGQLTASFENLPEVPFETFKLHLFAGERSLMATPTTCTIYAITADMFPWDAARADQTSVQDFGLETGPHGSECPGQIRPFEPTLEAGTATPVAGAFSSFTLKLNREDGDQYLGKLNFTMPPGLTANLRGVTYCPEADILAAANTPGKTEQADPELPGLLRNRNHQRRRRTGLPPLPRGRQDLPGRPLQGCSA